MLSAAMLSAAMLSAAMLRAAHTPFLRLGATITSAADTANAGSTASTAATAATASTAARLLATGLSADRKVQAAHSEEQARGHGQARPQEAASEGQLAAAR